MISKSTKINNEFNPFEEFKDIFISDKPVDLPPIRQPYDIMQHHIPIMRYSDNYKDELLRGKLMSWKGGKIPNYNRALEELGDKIHKELKSGRIKNSKATSTIPIFIKWKENGKPRFLLNCIPRNLVTEKDNSKLPDMDTIIEWITNMGWVIKIDLADGYHNIRLIVEDEIHTAFTCDLGTFESRVMQQGDCNAPRTMMRVMNYLLFDYISKGKCKVYLDDIIIGAKTKEEAISTCRGILSILQQNKFCINKEKFEMFTDKMKVLGPLI